MNSGIAAARVVGLLVDGSASGKLFAFLAVEIVLAALGTIAWLYRPVAS